MKYFRFSEDSKLNLLVKAGIDAPQAFPLQFTKLRKMCNAARKKGQDAYLSTLRMRWQLLKMKSTVRPFDHKLLSICYIKKAFNRNRYILSEIFLASGTL